MTSEQLNDLTIQALHAANHRPGDELGTSRFDRVHEVIREAAMQGRAEGIADANRNIINSILKD